MGFNSSGVRPVIVSREEQQAFIPIYSPTRPDRSPAGTGSYSRTYRRQEPAPTADRIAVFYRRGLLPRIRSAPSPDRVQPER
jgi:hypothetical protein